MEILVGLFFIFECLDIFLNKSENLQALILSYAKRWQKSPLLFLLTQFNFLFLSFCVFYLNLQRYLMLTLYFLYGLDCLYKIYLCSKISKNEVDDDLKLFLSLDIKIPLQTRLIFSLSVSLLFYLAI